MAVVPQLLEAQVMHRRHRPVRREFRYRAFYLCTPLSALTDGSLRQHLPVDRPGLVSFRTTDHGDRKGVDLEAWLRSTLRPYRLDTHVTTVQLVCLPRILGYVFNPVSFWLCTDDDDELRAVVCEVNNTFGETHSYVCAHDDGRPMQGADWVEAEKVFHVSPFLERNGHYRFQFLRGSDRLACRVDYYDAHGELTLQTLLGGTLSPLSRRTVRRAWIQHPFHTMRVIGLIHWQAWQLFRRGLRYISKPTQLVSRITRSRSHQNHL